MNYAEIYERIEAAAQCIINDIEADESDADVFEEEGRIPWNNRDERELATEIGILIGEQFLEVDV